MKTALPFGPDRNPRSHKTLLNETAKSSSLQSKVFAAGALLTLALAFLAAGCSSPAHNAVTDYRKEYNKPLMSPGAQFAALPPAVQNTIRAEAGSAEIDNVIKDTNFSRVVYHVTFQNHKGFPPLNIAADGSLLDPDMMTAIGAPLDISTVVTGGPVSGVSLNDLPKEAVKTIQRQAPDAEIDTISKDVHGDKTTYWVTFKDQMHSALHLNSDGTLLK